MTPLCSRNTAILLNLFVLGVRSVNLNVSGEAITTKFWDCCKPSCAWKEKAAFTRPVLSCSADDKPTDIDAGTGCNGGSAYLCSNQQPWSINDTFSYGFAGVFITPDLTGGKIEDAWCCACYQLNFTSDPLLGKSMIIQASNTAYDVNTANRFTLAVLQSTQHQDLPSLIRCRYPVATPLPMTHVPASTVSTRRCLVPKTKAWAPKKIATSCRKPCRVGVDGVSTGTKTQLTPGT